MELGSTLRGLLSEMVSGAVPCRVSKTALTILAAHEATPAVKANAVYPGWVRTSMGRPSPSRAVEDGAAGIVWAAPLPDDGPFGDFGDFFRDDQPIDW